MLGCHQGDMFTCVNEFYTNAYMHKAMTPSFLDLIPKPHNPQNISEYRHICLVGNMYMIIAELLARRLKKMIGALLSICHTSFISKRKMLDEV